MSAPSGDRSVDTVREPQGRAPNGSTQRLLVVALVLLDALAVAVALLLAVYLRLTSGLLPYTSPYNLSVYLRLILLAVPSWVVILAAHRLYRIDSLFGGLGEYTGVMTSCTFGVVAIVLLSYFERGVDLSRGWLALAWGLSILTVGGTRFLFRRLVFYLWRHGRLIRRAVIVGANEQAKAIARQLSPPSASGIEIVGFVDDFLPVGTPVLGGLVVLGAPCALPSLARQQHLAEIIAVPQAMAWESFQAVLLSSDQHFNGAQVRISPGFYELLTTGVRVDHKSFVPLLTPEKARLTGWEALLKALFNYVVVIVGAVVWLPTLLMLMALKKAAGGPVFQRQRILGRGGRPFDVLSFRLDRTVPVQGKEARGFAHRLDRSLWRSGLYRLPQVVHVLMGQMSVVGPRPIRADGSGEARWDELPSLLTVRPGMTGPWVVFGMAQESSQEERRIDLYYVRNWTIWLDCQILLHSISTALFGTRRSLAAFDAQEAAWTSSNPT